MTTESSRFEIGRAGVGAPDPSSCDVSRVARARTAPILPHDLRQHDEETNYTTPTPGSGAGDGLAAGIRRHTRQGDARRLRAPRDLRDRRAGGSEAAGTVRRQSLESDHSLAPQRVHEDTDHEPQ